MNRYPFSSNQTITEPDWEVYLRETGQKMVSEQSPRCLMEVRARLYELLTHCISPELIIKVIEIFLKFIFQCLGGFIPFSHSVDIAQKFDDAAF